MLRKRCSRLPHTRSQKGPLLSLSLSLPPPPPPHHSSRRCVAPSGGDERRQRVCLRCGGGGGCCRCRGDLLSFPFSHYFRRLLHPPPPRIFFSSSLVSFALDERCAWQRPYPAVTSDCVFPWDVPRLTRCPSLSISSLCLSSPLSLHLFHVPACHPPPSPLLCVSAHLAAAATTVVVSRCWPRRRSNARSLLTDIPHFLPPSPSVHKHCSLILCVCIGFQVSSSAVCPSHPPPGVLSTEFGSSRRSG